jgi:hypothetical protein
MDTDEGKVVGRVTPCAPGLRLQLDGAHGVTHPAWLVSYLGSSEVEMICLG